MIKIINKTRGSGPNLLSDTEKSFDNLLSRDDLGFFDIVNRNQLWGEAEKRALELRKKYKRMVVIGIGGSSLGGRALIQMLGEAKDQKLDGYKVDFLDNVDGLFFQRLMGQIISSGELEKTHWVLVSKSGGTLETLALSDMVKKVLEKYKIKLENHCTIISEIKQSTLYDWAKENNIPVLEIPLDIGGRFSVFTAVGMLPVAFAGHNINDIKAGASWAVSNKELVVDLSSQVLSSWKEKEWITGFWFYSSVLQEAGRWFQQLWAESLAKKSDRDNKEASQVSVPLPLVGSVDQHSVLQQLSQGKEKKFIWFFRLNSAEKSGDFFRNGNFSKEVGLDGEPLGKLLEVFSNSTEESLLEDGVDSLTLFIDKNSEQNAGALLMVLMLVVGTLGECLDINAYDQPGVERGKVLAKELIKNSIK